MRAPEARAAGSDPRDAGGIAFAGPVGALAGAPLLAAATAERDPPAEDMGSPGAARPCSAPASVRPSPSSTHLTDRVAEERPAATDDFPASAPSST
jgi:hypothetical protein